MFLTFVILSFVFSLAYVFIIRHYLTSWNKIPEWQIPNAYKPKTKITILIPARNEEEKIGVCLQSIVGQNYPEDLYEIIVLDDHSSDETTSIASQFDKVRVLRLADFQIEKELLSFKKKAIEIGIQHSKGDLIICTDADCITPKKWLYFLTSFYENNSFQFIAAPVNFFQEQNLLEKFQSLDFMGMMCVTAAGIHSDWQKMCNGANLAYSKKAFKAVNGFAGNEHLASGDDLFLMHKIAKKFPSQIGFLKNKKATVHTSAKLTLKSFVSQRLRWGTKNASYEDWTVTAVLALVFFFCCSIVFSFLMIPFWGLHSLILFLILLIIKTVSDYFFLNRMSSYFNRKDLMIVFFPSQILHILYIVFIGIASNLIKEYKWKGRNVR